MNRLCDEKCNECPLMNWHQNNRWLTFILNKANDKFGDEFYKIVQDCCPNLTVCNECRVDDFVHVERCTIIEALNKHQSSTGSAKND